MKKLLFIFVFVVIALTACTSNPTTEGETLDMDSISTPVSEESVSVITDSTSTDSTIVE